MRGTYMKWRFLAAVFLLLACALKSRAQHVNHATWIWYPDDYEIWLHKEVSLRRIQRTNIFPPFYRLDAPYGNVKFLKQVQLTAPEQVLVRATGSFSVQMNWEFLPVNNGWVTLPKGNYRLSVNVVDFDSLPCLYVAGKTIVSDSSWKVTCYNDKEATAGYGGFDAPDRTPLHFPFSLQELLPATLTSIDSGILLDFGKETFGYLQLHQLQGAGKLNVYYGESREEALSHTYTEIHDSVYVPADSAASYTIRRSRGLRYIRVVPAATLKIGSYSLLYEYLPEKWRGYFHCSNDTLNRIWQTAAYTLQLTTREFMLDGIKRDRWVWGGDARESFLMNYYLFFDPEVNKRTLVALRGKDPVEIMINHIPDYSMYWIISMYEYYLYTGDSTFIERMYPKMVSSMDSLCTRVNTEGWFEGKAGDNMFLDWAAMDREGALSAYQLLFARSVEAFADCARLMNDQRRARDYDARANEMKQRTLQAFWSTSQGGFVAAIKAHQQKSPVNRYANMFAILFHYLDAGKEASVKKRVLMNDSVQRITTPYMRFYELAALCELDAHPYVTRQILDYWGGMLALGATTFWEVYDPSETGAQHYAMYGHPFERSLCHAWGAGPLFLLGKYYLGVKPLAPGFQLFEVSPHLGGLKWIEGTVPTAKGDVHVSMDSKTIKITTVATGGVLSILSKVRPRCSAGFARSVGPQQYQVNIQPGKEVTVHYQSTEQP